jgi:hypothetical protein
MTDARRLCSFQIVPALAKSASELYGEKAEGTIVHSD